jgi:hypothetical protein
MLKTYCAKCHRRKAAGFDVEKQQTWLKAGRRMLDGEMPPKGSPAPALADRERLAAWVDAALKAAACADGIQPRPMPVRRLNRNEYTATVRDLLNIQVNAGHALPADGAGGEGFDNASETLFLSPIHAEKYLEAAKEALNYAAKDPRSRAAFLIAPPGKENSPEQAARKVIEAFLPRAFRRPAESAEAEKYLLLFETARKRGENYTDSVLYALQGVLISPHFLFRMEEANPQYAMASRLSYFLWGTMPDAELLLLAASDKLEDPETLKGQIPRMLKDRKTLEFAERFTEQWLGTRELGRDIKPDAKLFPEYYDAEVQSAIRYEPILFLQEILSENLSLLDLIDSKWTILTNKLARHYGITAKDLRQQPKRVELPENSHRGGLLSMAAVLAVSSYSHRTSPVLRGKWILDSLLGTPTPPPPPDVPVFKEKVENGEAPRTLRERLAEHRANAICASCHDRLDPPGFALDNYDVLGRWRTKDAGKPIDAKGVLGDGTEFDGPEQLKLALLDRKDAFVRNLTTKMLGYALGRGLTLEDHCAVDQIVEELKKNNYSAHVLIKEIVLSVPFRHQPGR